MSNVFFFFRPQRECHISKSDRERSSEAGEKEKAMDEERGDISESERKRENGRERVKHPLMFVG